MTKSNNINKSLFWLYILNNEDIQNNLSKALQSGKKERQFSYKQVKQSLLTANQ